MRKHFCHQTRGAAGWEDGLWRGGGEEASQAARALPRAQPSGHMAGEKAPVAALRKSLYGDRSPALAEKLRPARALARSKPGPLATAPW